MTSGRSTKPAATPHRVLHHVLALASLAGLLACGLAAAWPLGARAQGTDSGSLELVDPDVFRACGDPRNMPFSNDKGEGFENKLAELFAAKLGKKLSYTYFPQATGFVRMTRNGRSLRFKFVRMTRRVPAPPFRSVSAPTA